MDIAREEVLRTHEDETGKKEIQDNGMKQVEAVAQDRQRWRLLVCGLCSTGSEDA